MRNFVIINGVNSNTINGLGINELPPITKPEMRNIREEIDGRDGDIITELGYSAYDKTITIGLFGTGYDINNIISFFNGEGTITFSNEDDKYYKYKIINQIDYEALLKFKQATITFHCQPFKYLLSETPLEIEYDYIEQIGETLTLNNTGEATLQLSLKGNTSQTGTPTPDSPIPINVVSGDNTIEVCDKNFVKSSAKSGNLYYLNGATGYDSYVFKPGTYTLSYKNNSGTNIGCFFQSPNESRNLGSATSITFTSSEKFNVWFYRSGMQDGDVSEVQLEVGSTKTDYEPYNGDTYELDLGVENIASSYKASGSGYYEYSYDNAKVSKNMALSFMPNFSTTGATIYMRPVSGGTLYTLGTIATITSGERVIFPFTLTDAQITEIRAATGGFFQIYRANVDFTESSVSDVQLEEGTKANSYTPYGQTPIKMRGIGTYEDYFVRNSGKNLIQLTNQDFSIGDLHYSVDGGVLQSTGSRNPEVQKNNNSFRNNFKMTLSAGSYKVNYSESGTKTGTLNYYIMKYSDDSEIKRIQTTYDTFTLTEETEIYLGIYSYQLSITGTLDIRIMLCKDDGTAPIFEPYGTGQWCKYNAIEEEVLDGSTDGWDFNGSTSTYKQFIRRFNNKMYGKFNLITSTFKVDGGLYYAIGRDNSSSISFNVGLNDCENTGASFQTWLSTHITQVDYVLASPYLSLIEDETLISQLDNIQNAMSYEGQTNVSQVNNDKPFIISAKALEKGSDEVVVNNIGNATSKPLIALEGNGIVNIYLNNNQVLQANVEDKMNIDINTLEAYNPNTSALLNRQVIGNYNSMTFQPGNNKLTINGSLSKATITNYIRWL